MSIEKQKYEKGGFCFLGQYFWRYLLLTILLFTVVVIENEINYNYTVIQKAVQDGEVTENWHTYLTLALLGSVVGIFGTIIKIVLDMWTEKVTKLNFFRRYQFLMQSRKEACMLKYGLEFVKVSAITGSVLTIVNSFYTVRMMGIVKMTLPQYVGAITILGVGIGLGIWRGKLQKDSDTIRNAIASKEQTLTEHTVVSEEVLENNLYGITKQYSKRICLQILKNSISEFPKIIRVAVFLMLMYTILDSMKENLVYSYSYVVWTVYGYLLELALNIGYVVEDFSKVYAYKKEEKLILLKKFQDVEDNILSRESSNINFTTEKISINKTFSANVSRPDGIEAYYKLTSNLELERGKIALLEGDNGTGKSRFLKLLKQISIKNCISYDTKTAIMTDYASNFISKSEPLNFELIKRLANGLGLKRIPITFDKFLKMKLTKEVNGADQQLLTALQILYFAVMKYKANPGFPQLIILDEILGNISPENAPRVMAFISQELRKIGACTIIVTHCHKEVVHEYVDQVWQMTNDGDYICIEQI